MKSKIAFFDYFWNIIIGCKEHCNYCIAKKHITDNIVINKGLLNIYDDYENMNIFVNPYSEPYYWNSDQFQCVYESIKNNTKNNYWLFTKYPNIFDNIIIPKNFKITYSITCNSDIKKIYNRLNKNTWISFSPILENIDITYILNNNIEDIFLCKRDYNKYNYNEIKQSFNNVIEV